MGLYPFANNASKDFCTKSIRLIEGQLKREWREGERDKEREREREKKKEREREKERNTHTQR